MTIDALTARTYLTAALSQFLGLMGTSISIDILKIENRSQEHSQKKEVSSSYSSSHSSSPEVWIRVPRDDAAAVFTALSSWVGSLPATAAAASSEGVAATADVQSGVAWRVCAKGNYLGAIVHGSGDGVFMP